MRKAVMTVGFIVCAVVLYAAVLWITYIDDIVHSGEAYGFRIGDSKEITYGKARDVFEGKHVYILYPVGGDMYGPHHVIQFNDSEYSMLANRASWEIYLSEGYLNIVRLTFSNGILVEIYRHRQYFEIP